MFQNKSARIACVFGFSAMSMFPLADEHMEPKKKCPVRCYVLGDTCEGGGGAGSPCLGVKICSGVPKHAGDGQQGRDALSQSQFHQASCRTYSNQTFYPDDFAHANCGSGPTGFKPIGGCTVTSPTGIALCCFIRDNVELPAQNPEGTFPDVTGGTCFGPSPREEDCPDEIN